MRYSIEGVPAEHEWTDELAHYGILGMKWGVRRTPEELGHKPAGSKNSGGASLQSVAAAQKKPSRKEQKAAIDAAKAAAKQAEAERIRQMTHDKVLRSTDPSEIYAHRNELTNNELREAVDRVRYAQSLKDAIDTAAFKEAQAVMQRQSKGKEAINNALKKFGDAAVDAGAMLTKQGLQYAAKKGLEEAFGKETALQITDPQAYKAYKDKQKEASKAKFVQDNMQKIIDNPNQYSLEQLNAANTRLTTIRSLSSASSIFDQSTFDDMVANPERYSASDLARAAQQADQMNKIINRKTVGTRTP